MSICSSLVLKSIKREVPAVMITCLSPKRIAHASSDKNTWCHIKNFELDVACGAICTLRPELLRQLIKDISATDKNFEIITFSPKWRSFCKSVQLGTPCTLPFPQSSRPPAKCLN